MRNYAHRLVVCVFSFQIDMTHLVMADSFNVDEEKKTILDTKSNYSNVISTKWINDNDDR